MKKCCFCDEILEDEDIFCKHCGKKVEINNAKKCENGKENISSLFLKYSEYLSNDVLYRVALAKQRGLLKSDFPNEADAIFKVLAFKGHVEGIYSYVQILLNKSLPDEEIAYKWLKIAADRGHIPSINLLKSYNWNATLKKQIQSQNNTSDGAKNLETINLPKNCESFAENVKKVLPSIVMIKTTVKIGEDVAVSYGSGFVIKSGYVVTNAHIIGDNPECIEANFEPTLDKNVYQLFPLEISKEYDIAILSFADVYQDKRFSDIGLEISNDAVSYGQEVYTVGNPLGIGLSVSKGVISCPARKTSYPEKVDSVIQTDITINHGNSGGALLDINNRVVGITTFVPSKSEGGIGMCIPSNYINLIIEK